MNIKPFATEQYFALYEFKAPHLLSASDCETVSVAELCELAGVDLSKLGALRLHYTEAQGNPELRLHLHQLHLLLTLSVLGSFELYFNAL